MSLNPLAIVEQRIDVPRDLSAITTIDYAGEVNPEQVGLSHRDKEALWSAVERLYRTGMYPALSVCIRRHGQILLHRTIGHVRGAGPGDRCDKVLATNDTPQCLYSSSKGISAMLIHKLEEQGLIKLLDPVAYYIPEFGQNGKQNITIQQLLAHRAGIATIPERIEPEVLFDHPTIMKLLYEAEPTSTHGREQAYHAVTGGYIMGELVERITGMNMREYMRVTIQEPLGFRFFNYGVTREQYPEVARNYFTGMPLVFPVDRILERVLGAPYEDAIDISNDPRFYDQVIPAANLTATADECSRFFQCLLNGGELDGKRIFESVTIQRATYEVGRMQLDKTLFVPMRFSAGMMLGDSPISLYGPDTEHAFGHLGLSNNFVWADPKRAISVALLTSGNPVVGSHMPALVRFLLVLSKRCHPVFND